MISRETLAMVIAVSIFMITGVWPVLYAISHISH